MGESEFRPNINYKAETGGGGGAKEENKNKDNLEQLMGERAGIYPLQGADIIEALSEVEIKEGGGEKATGELKQAIKEALAYKEGLPLGVEALAYEIEDSSSDSSSINLLHNLFLTIEGASERPRSPYLDPALDMAVTQRARETIRYKKDSEQWRERKKRKYKKINRNRMIFGEPLISEEIQNKLIAPQELELKRLEEAALPILRGLETHIQAREIIDNAFLQRMATCEDPEGAGNLSKRFGQAISPDKTHWQALFQEGDWGNEWGEKVNKAFWEIVAFGSPDDVNEKIGHKAFSEELRKDVPSSIYRGGFDKKTQFKAWLNKLVEVADGDIDAVWMAWRVALLWEIPNELGIVSSGNEKEQNWKVGFPPIGSALMVWTSHLEEKRRIEFGSTGERKGTNENTEKLVSHSGLPMSLGKFPPLCKSFLHETAVKYSAEAVRKPENKVLFDKILKNFPGAEEINHPYFENMHPKAARTELNRMNKLREEVKRAEDNKPDDKDKINKKDKREFTLWDIGFFGGLGFSSKDFPWSEAEAQSAEEDQGEMGSGSYGSWLLKRGRSQSILEDIKSRPPLNELSDPDYFAGKLRNWVKVWGNLPRNVKPKDNPRAWWVAGLIWYHRAGYNLKSRLTNEEDNYKDYRTHSRQQEWVEEKKGSVVAKKPALGDILHHAEMCGFLRAEDSAWIKQSLKIRLRL